MYFVILLLFLYFKNSSGNLFSKGIVHYSINTKDYDPHSQEVIVETLRKIQNEVCVKFFSIPVNYTSEAGEKVLYIQNPKKEKICPPRNYDFSKSIIDMTVGYKCLNERDITRIVVEMLKASIHNSKTVVNSFDLIKKFQEKHENSEQKMSFLNPNDRNYINAHYFQECGGLQQRSATYRRQQDENEDVDVAFSAQNRAYYQSKAWPMGVVLYTVNDRLRSDPAFIRILSAMRTIEVDTCVIFEEAEGDDVLNPKSLISFEEDGADWPNLGFQEGTQVLKLSSIAGCDDPGHAKAHALMMMMRILGLPMMSNRHDRDNYVRINWKNVQKGEELYLEKAPEAAWVKQIPYDFTSASHAPANFLCPGCLTTYTVEPIQDHLWQRIMTMGRNTHLSPDDVRLLSVVYAEPCQSRVMNVFDRTRPDRGDRAVTRLTDDRGNGPDDGEVANGEGDAEGVDGDRADGDEDGVDGDDANDDKNKNQEGSERHKLIQKDYYDNGESRDEARVPSEWSISVEKQRN